ncbi:hypothetical protein [Mycolicibacterium komossense]|uniref:Uncharacterized protein n=1 Tax=Mycolicibacterium komossense TaxID=1779 RepID=A0ABT3CMW5_9MYCO|nr:hypothetical protein [Mycolicibacterium komossense]MCV7230712.1 hypothetical protein [Mycolicibacterium komossense]
MRDIWPELEAKLTDIIGEAFPDAKDDHIAGVAEKSTESARSFIQDVLF